MPYSQSVGVRCKLEDVKLTSGSFQWLTPSPCDCWHLMSLARRSTEWILDVVSEQTKHTWFPFLCYEETLIRDACHQSFSASTAISNSTRSTENNRFYVRKIDSSKSARSRHYYLAKSARSRHYHLASEWTIARYIYILLISIPNPSCVQESVVGKNERCLVLRI